MSLIQDALKRKAEETARGSVPAGASAGKSPRPMMIVLIFLLLIGLIAALTGLSFYLIKKPEPKVTAPVIQQPAPAVAPAISKSSVAVEPKPVAPVAAVIEPVEKQAPAPKSKTKWPELKLTGIAQTGSQSLAVLNGKMIPVGRTLDEVTVVEVNGSHIVVEYGGERRVLYINE